MSQSGSQAWTFYREVAASKIVWTVQDAEGFPAPKTGAGRRAQPFWSSQARAAKVVADVPAYSAFSPTAISWTDFSSRWVAGLTRDGLLVGVNWSGPRATGFDMEPEELRCNVQAVMDEEGAGITRICST